MIGVLAPARRMWYANKREQHGIRVVHECQSGEASAALGGGTIASG